MVKEIKPTNEETVGAIKPKEKVLPLIHIDKDKYGTKTDGVRYYTEEDNEKMQEEKHAQEEALLDGFLDEYDNLDANGLKQELRKLSSEEIKYRDLLRLKGKEGWNVPKENRIQLRNENQELKNKLKEFRIRKIAVLTTATSKSLNIFF